jgi:hypothetical protein
VELLFRPWIKNIASANTPYNFCYVRVSPLHSFTFPLHLFVLFDFNLVTPEAEKFNGWMAMIGFIAAFGAYATTGQIIPGIF